jgi:hypothetical protein
MIPPPDPDALLVALVLCPGVYSRNRFYSMYANPEASAVRRRAALVRSIVAELAHADPLRRGRVISIDDCNDSGMGSLTYVVSSLGLRRSTTLTSLELSIIQYAVTRRVGSTDGFDAGEDTHERIEGALRGLSPEIADSARSALENALFDDGADESVLNDALREE